MPKFLRSFWCRLCNKQATLDEINNEITLVECQECGAVEIWGDDTDQKMELFKVQDQPMAEC